jgi:hypothetical protein
MLSGLPLMRQVVGFLNCLKKNGLSNEKYVPRKRPRDFSQAGTLVVDIAAEQGQDRLPKRGRSRMPPALRRKGAYFVLRSPNSRADLTITPVASVYPDSCVTSFRKHLDGRNVHFSSPHGQVGLSVQAGTNKSPPVARRETRRLVRQGATIFKKEAIR